MESLLSTWVTAYAFSDTSYSNAEAILRGVLYSLRIMAKPNSFIPELVARCLCEMNDDKGASKQRAGKAIGEC